LPPEHALPHAPQFNGSSATSTQLFPQAENGGAHATTQAAL
jgi:hypothetical protein